MAFDPNGVGKKGTLFGYPYSEEEADLIVIPVPWDVTVSYGDGTSWGPSAVLEASPQIDFSLHGVDQPWTFKVVMPEIESQWAVRSEQLRKKAQGVITALEAGERPSSVDVSEINYGCQHMVNHLRALAEAYLADGKMVAVLGGDHSTPLGLLQALGQRGSFGILQIDAHMDLRVAYEGFTFSHASTMHNALRVEGVTSITQVGIRDYSQEEEAYSAKSSKPIKIFYDQVIQERLLAGGNWSTIVKEIMATLPQQVYISLDIDGLDPSLCPSTGTPVPGGLSFAKLDFLLREVARSGKRIVGFDLCEVSPGTGDWDANVGARVLYRLISYAGLSQGAIHWSPSH